MILTTPLPTLPPLFVERLMAILPPAEFAQRLASFAAPRVVSLRLNTLRAPAELIHAELIAAGFPLQPEIINRFNHSFTLPASFREAITHHPRSSDGSIYLQSLSSMAAPILLNPQPEERVLDLAAAPGGKTLLLAQLMENRGELAAVEPVRDRFFRLKANLERGGVTIARCFSHDGRAVGQKVPERFDRVLLDAPCSSESRFHQSDPRSWSHWSLKKIEEVARKQRRLLLSAIDALKPNGELLYCTCSFAPEENEAVVDYALRQRPAMALRPLELTSSATRQVGLTAWQGKLFSPQLQLTERILPDSHWHGFYLARLVKQAD